MKPVKSVYHSNLPIILPERRYQLIEDRVAVSLNADKTALS